MATIEKSREFEFIEGLTAELSSNELIFPTSLNATMKIRHALGNPLISDPHDAFVSNDYANLAAFPAGSVVGTSSLRRESQLRARFPHLDIQPLRGNVQTRLRKLDEGLYAAIILAAAGLKRLVGVV